MRVVVAERTGQVATALLSAMGSIISVIDHLLVTPGMHIHIGHAANPWGESRAGKR
jgi:hypothetical protein